MTVELFCGDCLDVMAGLEDESVDTVITDPPYGLEFMGKEWDKLGDVGKLSHSGPEERDGSNVFGRTRINYSANGNVRCLKCGKWKWGHKPGDGGGGGIGCQCEHPEWPNIAARQGEIMQEWHYRWAKEALRVAKPGAMLCAFGGSRTHHRLMCAIEDAGWEIRDVLMWLYGSGFPKSHDVSKAIDKAAGAEREVVGTGTHGSGSYGQGMSKETGFRPYTAGLPSENNNGKHSITAPATDNAQLWEGYGTALKPAYEIIVAAQKPLTTEQEQCIIVENLLQLEAQLWSLLSASTAETTFQLSPAEYAEVCGFAQWTADERRNTLDVLCAQMDMSQLRSRVSTCLHTVILWRSTLGESWSDGSTSTTKTETEKTIRLETLRSCVSALTPLSIIQAETKAPGSRLGALPAARYLNAAVESINATRTLSALGDAIEQGHTSHRDDLGLEPNYEPIILAMKPLPGTFAQNALGYGVAGLAIDKCRVGTNGEQIVAGHSSKTPEEGWDRPWRTNPELLDAWRKRKDANAAKATRLGRWPANLLLSHAPGCERVGVRKVKGNGDRGSSTKSRGGILNGTGEARPVEGTGYASPDGTETVEAWNCVPECPVFLLDQSSGESVSKATPRHNGHFDSVAKGHDYPHTTHGHNDTGGASRFFTRFHYSAKASRAERELGLLGHIPCLKCGELDSVTHMNVKTGKEEKCRRNGHPTVKPLDVCRWLCRLTKTPTGGVVLDPFMGSGRISMAAILEGRDTIGIELERPSFEIAQAAVQWAQEQMPEMVQAEMVV